MALAILLLPENASRTMNILKLLGAAIALVFVGVLLTRGMATMPDLVFRSGSLWAGLLGGFSLYVISQLIGAVSWQAVLRIYGIVLSSGRAESQLLVSQVGKYIPGNVAHFFGRIALARADGLESIVVTMAMLIEVVILLTAGVVVVGTLMIFVPDLIAKLTADLPDDAATILVATGIVVVLFGLIVGQIVIWRRAGRPRPTTIQLLWPLALHVANFVFLGLSLWCVIYAVGPSSTVPIVYCTAIFTTAWIAGFLMPGAPGGIGIRDGIIALGLELFIGQGAGLLVAFLHRMLAIFGDVFTFGLGLILRKRSQPS